MIVRTLAALAMVGLCACGSDDKGADETGDGSGDGTPAGDGTPGDGGDGGEGDGDGEPDTSCVAPTSAPVALNDRIVLPDSLCDDAGCRVGDCDPLGDSEPACNAWIIEAKGSFQAVSMKAEGTLGLPAAPEKSDEDPCPGFQVQPEGLLSHCCQRVTEQGAAPALKLTGLEITRPPSFASAAVAQTNKTALEGDLYNWAIVLDGSADGAHTAQTGNALPSADGSFSFLGAPVESGGETFNADGAWNAPANVPAELTTATDGTRSLCLGPAAREEQMVMAMWFDEAFDFARLTLPVRDVRWEVPLDAALLCSGNRLGQSFELPARLSAFMPVESARNAALALNKNGGSFNLCATTAGAPDCDGKASSW